MASDKEAQEDEMLAMQSIFDQDTFSIFTDGDGETPSGKIKVHLDLPESFSISATSEGGSKLGDKAVENSSNENQVKYKVQFLPPITLNFTFPHDYPSKNKPNFTLSSNWLHRASLSVLCRKMNELWDENKGIGVLFTWTNYLQSNVLTDLRINDFYDVDWLYRPANLFKSDMVMNTQPKGELTGPVASTSKGAGTRKRKNRKRCRIQLDRRAISEPLPQKADKPITLMDYLLEYNDEQIMTIFLQSSHSCEICFSMKLGSACIRLLCGHVFCKDCAKGYFSTHITDGNVDLVKCLAVDCQMRPTPEAVNVLVGEELYLRYDELLLKRAIESMTDVTYCPRPKCQSPVICDAGEKCAFCTVCRYNFCNVCKKGYHGVESCILNEDKFLEISEKYEQATDEEKRAWENTLGRKQLRQFLENVRSVNWIKDRSKPCPVCKVPIDRYTGCSMVLCTNCNNHFDWGDVEKFEDYPYQESSEAPEGLKKLFFGQQDATCDRDDEEGNELVEEYDLWLETLDSDSD